MNGDSEPGEGHEPSGIEGGHVRDRPLSRRSLLSASVAAGASALALTSGVASAHHTESVDGRHVSGDRCGSNDQLWVDDALVINNDWATSSADMCISHYGDGSFGWEWYRGETEIHGEDLPNYPQALIGTKPWADDSGVPMFPIQRNEVTDWDVELDVEQERSPNEWNFALEWWFTDAQPPGAGDTITHEIMLVLERSEMHTKDGNVVDDAVTDKYGNTFHYWESLPEGPSHDSSWGFHIFRTADNEIPSHIDLTAILDYLVEDPHDALNDPGVSDGNRWISGVEIGNEIWDETDGDTRVNEFNVRLNGETATAGVSGEFSEPPAPPASPTDLTVVGSDDSSVTLSWVGPTDTGDGALDHYVVTVDGDEATTVTSTEATVTGLTSDTAYEFAVVAVTDAGLESAPSSSVSARTDDGDTPGDCVSSIDIGEYDACDLDGDGLHTDVTGSGSLGFNDVVTFFEEHSRPEIQNNAQAFDFSGDGRVGFNDVVALFERL
ncbi:fibronectin type III domain-containing protein [Natronobiforma cellulositropha]|uniref:fibronectin type III domain-containing protein n=1 Tax=Natronobiforma cellulositropha TaxID=1679076 RepID=UPI0021D5C058|nr:fibronectin type III domain-containing protein [Natronobiforma cellulositropha]